MCEYCPSIRGAYCCVCQSYHVADTDDTLEIDLAGAKTGPLPRIAYVASGSTNAAPCEELPDLLPVWARWLFLGLWTAGIALLMVAVVMLYVG